MVELEGITPFIDEGTIMSRFNSYGFTYLIPLPFKEASGPRLFVFLWPPVAGGG